MATVAINGLGRIGRAALKRILETPGLELKGGNDLIHSRYQTYAFLWPNSRTHS